ncbi:MAG: EAL domain-containing protein, partial [Wenzhouxiangellaceae bacterium]
YDDFGAGQARLQELVEVPPDFLKFDIALVRGVGTSDSPRYRLLATLNTMLHDMGVQTLAEGIEDAETASACGAIGIDLFQGFFYGRPEPIDGETG